MLKRIKSGVADRHSGLTGDVSGLWGDLDACGITDEMRSACLDVETLVGVE
jgi:hypothetical protein